MQVVFMHVIHRTAIASLEMPVDWLKRPVNMMVDEVSACG